MIPQYELTNEWRYHIRSDLLSKRGETMLYGRRLLVRSVKMIQFVNKIYWGFSQQLFSGEGVMQSLNEIDFCKIVEKVRTWQGADIVLI